MQEIIVYSIFDGTKKNKMGIAKSISEAKQICLNTPGIKKQGIKSLYYSPKFRQQYKGNRAKGLPARVTFHFSKSKYFPLHILEITVVKIPDGFNVDVAEKDSPYTPGLNLIMTKRKPDNRYTYTVDQYVKQYTDKNRGWF